MAPGFLRRELHNRSSQGDRSGTSECINLLGNCILQAVIWISSARLQVRSCGILGIFTYDGWAASEIYEGLQMLQHRGQDSAGIVSFDGQKFREHKARETLSLHLSIFPPLEPHQSVCNGAKMQDNGLVKDVFGKETLKALQGPVSLGHVRYPTAGGTSAQEAQPFFVNSPLGIYLVRHPLETAHSLGNTLFARTTA